ncbi:GTPase domain-containing protein [Nocardioides stalactiti]|uniref:GTPase domain-containing protein n=1 Tax=Nocardioides stalactiti TaxID=2755356 RepID=UPI001603459B|nr:GTPase domain-containing protein [Nocardioides stalactiti]
MSDARSTGVAPPRGAVVDRELVQALINLRSAYTAAALPLDLPGTGSVRDERSRVLDQLDDYVLPRLTGLDAPALVVIGGPTGAGKSTLVNSLVGQKVTTPGLLRPTTRSPVLVHHPDDRHWFGPDRILPTLDRVDEPTHDHESLQLIATTAVPRGLALLDAPDFDSIDDRNRELATKLLGAADLLLFTTSAARYSDQVPWLQLSLALERETSVAVVMNRIPPKDRSTVAPHLARMLQEHGITSDQTFFVEHGELDADGLLPVSYVNEVRSWLAGLALDTAARSAAVRRTVGGAIRQAARTADAVADAVVSQVAAVSDVLHVADTTYAAAAAELRTSLTDGSLLRGDLWLRWNDFTGGDVDPGDLDRVVAVLRERLTGAGAKRAEQVDQLGVALDLALETVLVDLASRTAQHTARDLRATDNGGALLDWSAQDLSRPGKGLSTRARTSIRACRQRLVEQATAEMRSTGAGVSGVAEEASARALAIVLILAGAGAEASSPTDALSALPGLSALVEAAGGAIAATLTALLAEERDRYLQPVLDWGLAPDAPGRLRDAAIAAERMLARHERQGA